MRILVLNPFAGEAEEVSRCARVARPDTEIVFASTGDDYPMSYVTYVYYRHRAASAVVERVIQAEREGFDAVFICCCYDPGLWEARELVDIPVTAAFEAGVHYANQISQRYSVLSTEPKTSHCYRELAELYGAGHKLASVRPIGLSARESYGEEAGRTITDLALDAARLCVEHDGAEAIVMGCTLQSCPLTLGGSNDAVGAPIIDPVLVGVKYAEYLVELRRAGLPVVSRYGTFQKPPADEVDRLRRIGAATPV